MVASWIAMVFPLQGVMMGAWLLSSVSSRSSLSRRWRFHPLLFFLVAVATVLSDVPVQAYTRPSSVIRMVFSTTSSPSISTSSTSTDISTFRRCNILICGGGPVGLASALSLARRGYTNIHIVERNPSASYFEVDKSYLYRIDGRGQKLTDQLGITERMFEVSTTTSEFLNITIIKPDGSVSTVPAPADPSQKTAYWLPRPALLSFLNSRIQEDDAYRDAITFHYGASIEGLILPSSTRDELARVRVRNLDGTSVDFTTRRVLGCDGMKSKIRTGLAEWAVAEDEDWHIPSKKENNRFSLHFVDSVSCGLRYKILTLLDNFPLTLEQHAMDNVTTDKNLCYSYVSKSKPGHMGGFRLGLLPLKMGGIPRTANIIARSTAPIFSFTKGTDVIEYLRGEFPQCDVDRMISVEEAERFAQSPGGYFPMSQYCLESQMILGKGVNFVDERGEGSGGGVVLLGDAIHAFPPDLGAGVNIAFLDVLDFMDALDRCNDDWSQALPQYEKLRAIQSKAVCELIPIGFPEQYNHMPGRKSIKLLGVGMRVALNKALPRLFSPPVFFMCQDVNLDYMQIWEKAKRTTRILTGLGIAMISAMLGALLRKVASTSFALR